MTVSGIASGAGVEPRDRGGWPGKQTPGLILGGSLPGPSSQLCEAYLT